MQQILVNRPPYIVYEDIIKLYKKCFVKLGSFLLTDNTFASDIPVRFRKNLL